MVDDEELKDRDDVYGVGIDNIVSKEFVVKESEEGYNLFIDEEELVNDIDVMFE